MNYSNNKLVKVLKFLMEYSIEEFQYNSLPQELSDSIIEKENILNGIKHRYAKEVGKVFYEAQQEFSDFNNGGLFEKWYTSIGFKKQNVYNYIQIYNEVQQLDGDQLETFEELPKRLQLEVSKPSHIPELKEKVLDGDIKTHKEYKELEKQLKQRDEEKKRLENQLKNSTRSEGILQDKLEQLENKPPKVIERFLEPEDYQQIKTSLEQKESYISELQTEVANMRNERNEMDKKSREYDRLNEAINEMNGRLNEGQMRIKNQKAVYDLIRKSEELVKEVAPLVYALDHLDVEDNEYAKKPIIQLIKNIDDISQKLKKQLSERQIIEVN